MSLLDAIVLAADVCCASLSCQQSPACSMCMHVAYPPAVHEDSVHSR